MNYRHAFHAGNFADVMKHALLLALIEQLKLKDKPFCVLDFFAGDGIYRLDDPDMQRGQEFNTGIYQALDSPEPALQTYLNLVHQHRLYPGANRLASYPGSPLLARQLLRPQDQLILSDLKPDCAEHLRRLFGHDAQVRLHQVDAYQACRSLLPPTPRRGLLLLDPPFERIDEFQALLHAVEDAERRWPVGIIAIWYPIKQRTAIRGFHRSLAERGFSDVLSCELYQKPLDNFSLTGSGLTIINAPWQFDKRAYEVLKACKNALSAHEIQIEWVVAPEEDSVPHGKP